MAAGVFDIAKGREVEFHYRVNDNDPANSALILLVLANAGLVDDDVLRAYATVAAILAGASNEVTNTGYSRKTFTDAEVGAPTVDTSLHKTTLALSTPLQTFTTILAGDAWRKGVLAYDSDTTGGTDANIVPVVFFDIQIDGAAVVPNGNNINIDFSSGYAIAR
jgi:hypothetical protein